MKTNSDLSLKGIIDSFDYQGQFISYQPYGEGHINDTYLIDTTTRRYIMQKVNSNVFKKPTDVIENIELVTEYLHKKIIERHGDVYRETLTLIPTHNGGKYIITPEGELYRMYVFIEGADCYQKIDNAEVFYAAAKAFGNFQKQLDGFNASKLHETIANFHNTADRYDKFIESVNKDRAGRLSLVSDEVEFVKARKKDTAVIADMIKNKEIPLRVTHNDTKLNNILIDSKTGEGICVIDLDTVMPGTMLYDFGDSVRFGASSAAEDETDLEKVYMVPELFDAYTRGYLEVLGDSITDAELKYLAFSAKLMTFECGMRFLTDYLDGDTYFRTKYENHNLDRARNQFKLVSDMENKMAEMEKAVLKYSKQK